jgi:uncharacterized protein (TIGR00661 family)
MKRILYAIQATGNGHLNRALSLVPGLKEKADVDILMSGEQGDLNLPFEVKYRFKGLTYFFGKNGGIDIFKSLIKMNIFRFFRDMVKLPVEEYDLIISDFEPILAWAAKLKEIPCIAISNQATIFDHNVPRPKTNDLLATIILKYYVPADIKFGYNYFKFADNIYTPLIRKEIRECSITDYGHYTVYLPSFSDDKIISILSKFEEINWHVFSKNADFRYKTKNIDFFPIDREKFTSSMVSSRGILCNAGFETTSEALFLGKKLLVIAQKRQYEQLCNVHILNLIGIRSIAKMSTSNLPTIENWLLSNEQVKLEYPDYTEEIVNHMLKADFNQSPIKAVRTSQTQIVMEY